MSTEQPHESLEGVDAASRREKKGISAEELIALLNPPSPAPTDEEVERILEEELLRKYS